MLQSTVPMGESSNDLPFLIDKQHWHPSYFLPLIILNIS